jgi:1-acyl-sn-glycerol-3-phosphate acyltransferase
MEPPEKAAYQVPFPNRVARFLFVPVFRALFHILARIKVTGRENVPFGKPYLVAMNHVSTFDPPFLICFWPEMIEVMGASDIWNRPGQSQLVRMYHGIPIHRGEYDRALFDKALGVLSAGKPLLLAPEGGRSHQLGMRRAFPGISLIIEKSGVPVVPVGIVGTTDDFMKKALRAKRPQLEMRIGKPFLLPKIENKGEGRHEARQRNADYVMAHIAELLPDEYRGYYGG